MKKSSDGVKQLQYIHSFDDLVVDPSTPAKIIYGDQDAEVYVLWDTGAVSSCISKSLASYLGVRSIYQKYVAGATGAIELVDVGVVDINLLENDTGGDLDIHGAEVYIMDLSEQNRHGIIGMNVLRQGKFVLENIEDSFTRLTFEVTISQ